MEEKKKLKRAISPVELDEMKIKTFDFTGEWFNAFGNPEATGTWFIWGGSGSGKTRFVAELTKYLTNFLKVHVNSLEEGASSAMQDAWRKINMREVTGRVSLQRETFEDMCIRLDRRKAAGAAVVDSAQYTRLTVQRYMEYQEKNHGKRLTIFTSHADGKEPDGKLAKKIMYDANLKIWVEGYRAYSKGRSIGPQGYFTIWREGAATYWGDK